METLTEQIGEEFCQERHEQVELWEKKLESSALRPMELQPVIPGQHSFAKSTTSKRTGPGWIIPEPESRGYRSRRAMSNHWWGNSTFGSKRRTSFGVLGKWKQSCRYVLLA